MEAVIIPNHAGRMWSSRALAPMPPSRFSSRRPRCARAPEPSGPRPVRFAARGCRQPRPPISPAFWHCHAPVRLDGRHARADLSAMVRLDHQIRALGGVNSPTMRSSVGAFVERTPETVAGALGGFLRIAWPWEISARPPLIRLCCWWKGRACSAPSRTNKAVETRSYAKRRNPSGPVCLR